MTYLDLVCSASVGTSLLGMAAAWNLVRAARKVSESAGALAWAAKTQTLTAQRLTAEMALLDGLIRDLAHGHGLHYPDEKFDMGLPDGLARGLDLKENGK